MNLIFAASFPKFFWNQFLSYNGVLCIYIKIDVGYYIIGM